MIEKLFDALRAEQNEADVLINRGISFEVPMRSPLKYFSRTRQRTFVIHQLYLGTLDIISRIFLSLPLDEAAIAADPLREAKRISAESARKCALAIAIAVLNSQWKIKLFSGLLANYFLWRIQPSRLVQVAFYLNQLSNLGDFISSIRLMSAIRTTAPSQVEKKTTPAD
ncbi:hypothetical protein [Emticicia sp. 17c]|uniref:hypothetical protein n=1 Tax=Emticicia sp. 17c TaxID=3127704 RepID=UPI00301BAF80